MCAVTSISTAGASPLVRIKQFCCRQPWTCVAIAAIAAVGVLFALKVLPLTFCLATGLAASAVVALIAVAVWKKFKTDHPSAASAGSGTASTGTSFDREIAASISSIRYSSTDGRFVATPTPEGVSLLRHIHQQETVLSPLTIYIPACTKGVSGDSTKELTTQATDKTPLEVPETYYVDCIQRLLAQGEVSLEGERELMLSRENNIEFVGIARTWAEKTFPEASSATGSLLNHFAQGNYQVLQMITQPLAMNGGLADYMSGKTGGSQDTPSYQAKISFKNVDGRLVADYEVREQRLAYDATVHFSTQVELTDRGYRGVGEIQIEKIEGRFKPEYLAHLQRAAQE